MTTTPNDADPFGAHRVDPATSHDGVWIEIRGDRFRVARMGNERWAKIRPQFLAERGLKPDADIVGADLLAQWTRYAFSRVILVDAKFQRAPDVPYDTSHGDRIFDDPELLDLKLEILDRSRGDYTREALAEVAALGNSEPYSNGSASTDQSETR